VKRSRTRRIVSLFMVLTGILLVFGGFLQEAQMPASVAQEPELAGTWPKCAWTCGAQDVRVTDAWIDYEGDPCGHCEPGEEVTASLYVTIMNNTGTARYDVWYTGDVVVGGNPPVFQEACATDKLTAGASVDLYVGDITWECGEQIKLENLVVSWVPKGKAHGCSYYPPDCESRTAHCSGPEVISVTTPVVAAFTVSTIDSCSGDVTLTASATGGEGAYTYTWNNLPPCLTPSGNTASGTCDPGTYSDIYVTVCDEQPCCDDSDTIGFTIFGYPTATAPEVSLCEGYTQAELDEAIDAAGDCDFGVETTTDNKNGTYTVKCVNEMCSDSATGKITEIPDPSITCPDDITVSNDLGQSSAVVTWPAPTVTGDPTTVSCDPPSGSTFSVGTTDVMCQAVNDCGSDVCSFSVTVNDTEDPVITCPPDREVCTIPGQETASVNLGWPTVSDNYDTDPMVSNNAPATFPEGDTTVTWTATDASGNSATCTQKVTVKVSPVASFDTGPGVGPLDVQFTDTSSGNIVGWSWVFGDGGTSTDQNPSHPYAAPGSYTVILTVTDANDCTDSIEQVTMVSADMLITITSSDDPCDGNEICFRGWADVRGQGPVSLSALEGYTFLWNFGDGETSGDEDPCHEYKDGPDTYDVTLTVTHEDTGITKTTAPKQVTVWANPTAGFTADPTSGVAPLTVQFTDGSSKGTPNGGAIIDWDWDFGDGETSDSQNPSHYYASADIYTVILMVTDEHGCTDDDTATVIVTVAPRPELSIEKTGDKDEAWVGQEINYTIKVTNSGDVTLTNVVVNDTKLGIIDLNIGDLDPGETYEFTHSYTAQKSDVGWLDNTASASSDQVGPVEAKWSVWVVDPGALPALLSIEKTADTDKAMVGETIEYTIKVENTGDATLTNVVVNDAKLGIIDLPIGDLDPGDTAQLTPSYGPLEESDVGFVDNTAIASSDQAGPVWDSWRVQVVETEAEPEPTPTPTRIPCIRSDIDVIVYGKIPVEVDMYVAGDAYDSQRTAVNAFGEQQATFSVWPGEGETYVVSITPRVPGYLAPDEWTFQLIEGSLSMRIPRCVHREVILQLLHSGPSVTPAPTLPVEELPVTGVPLPASSFGGRLLKLLGFLLIGSGGLFYWTSRRD